LILKADKLFYKEQKKRTMFNDEINRTRVVLEYLDIRYNFREEIIFKYDLNLFIKTNNKIL